jgi:tetratricopeptide (TPR) repeat protein
VTPPTIEQPSIQPRAGEATVEQRAALREAMRLHAQDQVDAAIAAAETLVESVPDFCEAHAYLGNTLVTRKRRFADGLAALERAAALCPHDAGILYTLGWCREFVANALEKPRAPHQPVEQDAATLYALTTEVMLRALTCDPEPGLRGDIEDILDVVANATGVPWDEGDDAAGDGA